MLHVVTGPFHPFLESAFIHDLTALKADYPAAPVAVIVPSEQLRRYLTRLLVLKEGVALFNVHILSFHQLALHLEREQQSGLAGEGRGGELDLVSDLFFEQLLRHVAQRRLPHVEALRLSGLPHGAWSALWVSLRDLKDALVDPALAIRAVEEGQFGTEDNEKLKGLFTLLAALREGRQALQVGSADDLAASVTDFVLRSPFLGSLRHLWYYGSYDLTQTQLSLLEALGKRLSVTLYFPLGASPAYGFAKRFLERHLHPILSTSSDLLAQEPFSGRRDRGDSVSIVTMNAAGAEDELTLVCKQILMLVETNGYRFDEIAVVARSLTPYQGTLRLVFDQHRIPFVSSAATPLLESPVVKTLLQAAQLSLNGFYRADVLDVVASPRYRDGKEKDAALEPRPDLWRVAVLALGITRGEEEWRRLSRWQAVEAWTDSDGEIEEELPSVVAVEPAQLGLLWRRVERLLADATALPQEGGYGELTDAYLALVDRHLALPELTRWLGDRAGGSSGDQAIGEALDGVFTQLYDLDRLGQLVKWEEWVETFADLLERTTVPLAPAEFGGVEVLDAMAARGLGFRALFLIGLNDKLFPRFIHEDGFLRDRHRSVLDETLGYKLDQKLQGYAEEALLFELLRASARERLYLSYQRVDAGGRALAPSSYLDARHLPGWKMGDGPDLSLPRRWRERNTLALFAPPLLTREELSVAMVLEGHDVTSLLAAMDREGDLFAHGMAAQLRMEGDQLHLGAYDGLLDGAAGHWAALRERGLSPTALETYVRCPFQYFAEKVLKLESVRQVPTPELPPSALGQLCHESLRHSVDSLTKQGWPLKAMAPDRLRASVIDAVARTCDTYATNHGTGYVLTWLLAQEAVARVVLATIKAEESALLASGAVPLDVEVEATGQFSAGPADEPIAIHGFWDRVDRVAATGALRIIDYKFRAGSEVKAEDRNLLQAAVRGKRVQPAMYSLMQPTSPLPDGATGTPELVEFVYLLPDSEQAVERAQFAADTWSGPAGTQLRNSLGEMIEGVRKERFFILPDSYCAYCEFAVACRRDHQPTWWRSYRAAEARKLRELRRRKIDDE